MTHYPLLGFMSPGTGANQNRWWPVSSWPNPDTAPAGAVPIAWNVSYQIAITDNDMFFMSEAPNIESTATLTDTGGAVHSRNVPVSIPGGLTSLPGKILPLKKQIIFWPGTTILLTIVSEGLVGEVTAGTVSITAALPGYKIVQETWR